LDLTAHCPLRLSTMNWLSATLVEPAEQPDQQDDWDRDPDQPEQKTSTHYVLLLRFAHLNARWELRFHEVATLRRVQTGAGCHSDDGATRARRYLLRVCGWQIKRSDRCSCPLSRSMVGFPAVHRGWNGTPSLISPRLLLMTASVMGNRGVGDGWQVFCGVVGKNRRPEPGSPCGGSCKRR
jgi:hypothetical protein